MPAELLSTLSHHAVHGQTLGKAVMHIYVCDGDRGDAIGYGRAFVRWLMGMVLAAVKNPEEWSSQHLTNKPVTCKKCLAKGLR